MIKGVVFDMDYTLYDRVETDRRAIGYFFDTRREMFAPACTRERAVEQMAIVSPINSRKGWGYTAEFLFEAGVLAERMDAHALCDRFQFYYHEGIVPYAFGDEMLGELKKMGLKMGLITNGALKYQAGKVYRLGFFETFPHVLIGCDPETAKPHPNLFLEMADLLGAQPSELLYVGDHPTYDVRASAAAGYTPVWVRACPWDSEGEPPEHCVDSVEELPKYVKDHFEIG